MNPSKELIKIIQVTDTHLFKKEQLLFDMNPNRSFEKIMGFIQEDSFDADAIFLTGDLSQDETLESYEMIADSFSKLDKKIYWIPGNHDSITKMNSVFEKRAHFFRQKTLSTSFWDFIFLDTKCDGKESGYLSDEELFFVRSKLEKDRTKPVALVMHHHPIEVNTPLIDHYILENKEALFHSIQHAKVDLIICGHVHNDYSLQYHGVRLESSPATCFQFKKGATHLEIEQKIGYKVYYFSRDGYVAETKYWTH